MSTFIIAEAGVNHNGNVDTALKLVDAASEAGADAVKFQTFKAEKVVTSSGSQREMLKELELSQEECRDLYTYSSKKKIIFISTPFDEESADFLDSLGLSLFKVASGEITNKPLIQRIASKNKPIILSTGMSYLSEVEKAILWIEEVWDKLKIRRGLTLLHCLSTYPAPFEEVNLMAMKTMERAFGLPVGLSDHTLGIEVAIAAAAMGATVIEKHLTLDRNMRGPDHKASLEPDELKELVRAVRNLEKARGDGVKRPAMSEEKMRDIARRSLVAARDIKAGETITTEIVEIKRPGHGIPPEFKEIVTGMRAARPIKGDSVIRWEDLKDA